MEKVFSSELLYRAVDRRRRDKQLSWHAAAREMGFSRWVMHRVMHDRSRPQDTQMAKILAWLGIGSEKRFWIPGNMQYMVEHDVFHLEYITDYE